MYCDNYFENIDAMDDFLRKYNVPKLIQIVKNISYVIKGMSQKKTLTEAKNVFDWLDMAEERISELEGI